MSSHGQKPDLGRQVARRVAWAARSGQAVARVGAEVGPGMSGARSKVRRLVVLDPAGGEDGLVRDMTEILTSFCARLYGCRLARNRAERALRCAARDAGLSPGAAG